MNSKKRYGARAALLSALILTLIFSLSLPGARAQDDKDKKKNEPPPQGTPVFWRDPGNISSLDLLAGPGGDASRRSCPCATRV